jgi:hypothetical protein
MRISKGAIMRANKRRAIVVARNSQKMIAQGAKQTYEVRPTYGQKLRPLTNKQREYLREGKRRDPLLKIAA